MATTQITLKPETGLDPSNYSYGCVGTVYANVHESDNAVQFNYCPECYLGQQFDGGERESKDLISASLLAGIRKGLEEFRQGLSDWTDSDNEKEN